MANKLDAAAFKIFEDEMKARYCICLSVIKCD